MKTPFSFLRELLLVYYRHDGSVPPEHNCKLASATLASGIFICPKSESTKAKRTTMSDYNEKGAELKWNAEADQYNQWGELGQDERDKLIAEFAAMNKEGQP